MKKTILMATTLFVAVSMTSCNSEKSSGNPFFAQWDTPFEIPPFEKIKHEHFLPAIEKGIELENAEIEAIIENDDDPSFDNVIVAFTETGDFLDKVLGVYGNLCSAELTDSLKQLQKTVTPMLTKHSDNIMLNPSLAVKVKSVYDNRESMNLDKEQLRLIEKVYKNFLMNGANLPDNKKDELRKINEKLSDLTLTFGNNLLKDNGDFRLVIDNKEDLVGLPESIIEAASITANKEEQPGRWVFTLDKPSMIPFLQYSDNRELREKFYKGYLNRCNNNNEQDNKKIIDQIVNLRIEKANLLGFGSHSEFVLERSMAKTPNNVYGLLDELWTPALGRASKELQEMKAIKKKESKGDDFESWDWWYYAEKLRKSKYDLDEEMLRPYFSLEGVREGIFTLCDTLYGLKFVSIDNAPVYNEECQTYEVFDKDGSHLGALIMDFHPRAGKRVGAWCSSFRSQSYEDNNRVAPIVTIVCNFTRPTSDAPALLNLDEVETFFHEFGHALHGLMSDVKYSGLQGVSRDFVELPSQIMENWAIDPQMLKLYAKHYKTGEVIPEELIQKISNSSLFNQGFATVEYLAASLLDMDYHTRKAVGDIDVETFETNSLDSRKLMKEIVPRYRSTYFQHIFSGGYSSGYYSYIWAEVLDADAYEAFIETGDVFNKSVADSFRKNILERRGSDDEMQLYLNFRGKEPSKKPLMEKRGLI